MGCCAGKENVQVDEHTMDLTDTTPHRERKCRDCVFLILFICALGGAGYLSYESVKRGDPERYIYGSDSWGNVCGRSKNLPIANVSNSGRNMTDHFFEFYTALSDIKMALHPMQYVNMESGPAVLCVKKCPNETAVFCRDFLRDNGYNIDDDIIDNRVCQMPAGLILPHTNVLNRCVPSVFVNLGSALAEAGAAVIAPGIMTNISGAAEVGPTLPPGFQGNEESSKQAVGMSAITQQILSSVSAYWLEIVYLTLISIVVSLLTLIFLQLFTRVLVITIIVAAASGTVAATAYLWYTYVVSLGVLNIGIKNNVTIGDSSGRIERPNTYHDELTQFISASCDTGKLVGCNSLQGRMDLPDADSLQITTDGLGINAMAKMPHLLPMAIGATVLMLLVLILLVWVRKSLCLVISLFDEASMAVFSMPGLLLQPLKTVISLGCVTVPSLDPHGLVRWVESPEFPAMVMIVPHLFVYFWLVQFIFACQEIIFAGAVSKWFFSKAIKQSKCQCNMCATVRPSIDLLLYNLGSAALGSLIIAIVWLIRTILGYIQTKLRKSNNKLAKRILSCLQCLLACFEKVLKYINRNAYIAIAMYGDSFCGGARRALSLLVSNAQHVVAINCIGGFCLLLGKVAVTVAMAFIGIAWFTMLGVSQEQYLAPLVIACCGSFIIASCFFTVFDISLDTIFLCFCDDQQRNNGQDRPYYSSEFLQRYMTTGVANNRSKSKRKSVAKASASMDDQPQTSTRPVNIYPKLPTAKSKFGTNFKAEKEKKNKIFRRIFVGQPHIINATTEQMRMQPTSNRSDANIANESVPVPMWRSPRRHVFKQ